MRLKNLFLVMGLLFVIGIYIGVVSAQAAVTCNIKQYNGANINTATEVILLEVSGLTNAHATKVTLNTPVANHYYVVCPKSAVNPGGSSTYNPSSESNGVGRPKNTIIALSYSSNAHAHIPDGGSLEMLAIYNTHSTFGKIECTWTDPYKPVSASYNINVLSLSDAINAHIAEYNYASYPIKIKCKISSGSCSDLCTTQSVNCNPADPSQILTTPCTDTNGDGCKEPGLIITSSCLPPNTQCDDPLPLGDATCIAPVTTVTKMEWRSATLPRGNNIFQTIDGTTVYACIQGTNINEKIITYKIYEDDSGLFCGADPSCDDPLTPAIITTGVTDTNNYCFEWDATYTSDGGNEPPEFYFWAEINGVTGIFKSPILSNTPNTNPNQGNKKGLLTVNKITGCVENWKYSAWSACSSGTQTRTATDLNNCGTTNNILPLTRSCTTCGNGVYTDTGEQCDLGSASDAEWTAAHCNKPGIANQCQCEVGFGTITPSDGKCISTITSICEDHGGDQSDCEADHSWDTTRESGESTIDCRVLINSGCVFVGGLCGFGDKNTYFEDPSCGIAPPNPNCKWDTKIEGECSAGAERVRTVFSLNIDAVGGTPPGDRGECLKRIPPAQYRVCPQRVLIPFFTWINLLIAIIVIALIYLFYYLFNSKKKKIKIKGR